MKKFLTIVLAVIAIAACMQPVAPNDKPAAYIAYDASKTISLTIPDAFENDDTQAAAKLIDFNTLQERNFYDDANDWVSFSATAGSIYTIETTVLGSTDTVLYVYDGSTQKAYNDDKSSSNYGSKITFTAPATKTYTVKIYSYGGKYGSNLGYSFSITTAESLISAPVVSGSANGTSATWTWGAVQNAAGYRYSLDAANGPWTQVASTVLSYTASGLASGSHTLYVQASSSTGVWSNSGQASVTISSTPPQTSKLRLMAANLTSGTNQSYTDGPGIRIMTGCKPDVVMIQEFNYKSYTSSDLQEMANLVIYGTANHTPNAYYYRGTGSIPNGIISKYPFVSSGQWDDTYMTDREFVWARIDIPGSIDLWAVSIHIKASSDSTSKTKRTNEATLLKSYIEANVPAGLYLAVGGDYNTYSNSTSTEPCLAVFGQFTVFPDPNGNYPADRNGNIYTNAGRTSPYDRILVNSALHVLQTPVIFGSNTFTWGLVADTRVYNPIADLAPALSTDSGVTNMQHMGIVRDFTVGN